MDLNFADRSCNNIININKIKLCESKNENLNRISGLHALSCAVIDGDNGRVLYEASGYEKLPMASTTKIMTCLLALENSKSDEILTVSKYAASMPSVKLGISQGDQYYLKDILYALMLESCNDTAVAIGEHISGTVEDFAKLMNKKAKKLGLNSTNFVTPNGLDADNHYTTAVDLCRLAAYALKNKDFKKIINTKEYSFSSVDKKKHYHVSNKNAFLNMLDGAIGVKTGYTSKAGYCFTGAVEKNNQLFISSVLGCSWPPFSNNKWQDTKKLIEYCQNNYSKKKINISTKKIKDEIVVKSGVKSVVSINYDNLDFRLNLADFESLSGEIVLPEYIVAPISTKDVIGKIILRINGKEYKTIKLHPTEDIQSEDIVDIFMNICKIILD